MSIHRGLPFAAQIARRALVLVALAGLAGTPLLSAHAQTAPQANTPPVDSDTWPGPPIASQTQQDPPGRVGRIAKLNGTVSFHTADQDQWSPATLNYPLTSGNALWTEPGARAEVQIGDANRLVMDSGTELDVTALDDHTLQATLPQGAAYLRVHDTAPGDEYAIQTPRGTLQTTMAGRYAIVAGDADHPTMATVIEGSAQFTGPNTSLLIPAGQMVSLTGPVDGSGPVQTAMTPMRTDDPFIASAMKEDRNDAPPPAAAAPQPALPQRELAGMTGAQDLMNTGSWSTAPQYGAVWYPPVDPGWVPYRYGHWAYVPPWGWTWVADEPWGFAPFHYGRWVIIDDRWAWTPGVYVHYGHVRPVYAPALVAFFGGDGWSVSVVSGSNVGWVPLGPREIYYPPYRCSRSYVQTVNITHVTNVTNIATVTRVKNVTVNRYVNNRGATIVPTSAMTDSRHIQRAALPVEQRQYANQHPSMQAPLKPTKSTLGMAKPERHAPGPQIRSTAFQADRGGRAAPMHDTAPAAKPTEPQLASREAPAPRATRAPVPAPRPMSREQAAPTRHPPAGADTANRAVASPETHRPVPQAKPQPSQQQLELQRQSALRQQDMQRQQESQRQLQMQRQQEMVRRQQQQQQAIQRQHETQQRAQSEAQRQQQMQRAQEAQRQMQSQRQQVQRQQQMQRQASPPQQQQHGRRTQDRPQQQ